jgi:hypothetical protein
MDSKKQTKYIDWLSKVEYPADIMPLYVQEKTACSCGRFFVRCSSDDEQFYIRDLPELHTSNECGIPVDAKYAGFKK